MCLFKSIDVIPFKFVIRRWWKSPAGAVGPTRRVGWTRQGPVSIPGYADPRSPWGGGSELPDGLRVYSKTWIHGLFEAGPHFTLKIYIRSLGKPLLCMWWGLLWSYCKWVFRNSHENGCVTVLRENLGSWSYYNRTYKDTETILQVIECDTISP